jgi:hypothetical protein
MKDYLTLWAEGSSDEGSRTLTAPVTVIGEWNHGAKSEFAKVQLTVQPAKDFDVVDAVEQKNELETLDVGWPDPVILGLLDTLMNAGPLRNVRVTLERGTTNWTLLGMHFAMRDATLGVKLLTRLIEKFERPAASD